MSQGQDTENVDDERVKGAKRFDEFLAGDNPTGRPIVGRVAAAAIKVTEPTIGHWRNGTYSPDPGSRCVIEAWTDGKVKVEWWETEAEKARIKYANTLAPYGQDEQPRAKRAARGR